MKNILYDTKSKQKLLVEMCAQPKRHFSVKELAMRTGTTLSRTKQLLLLFTRHGIVNSSAKKRERYYQINRHSPSYIELSAIFKPGPTRTRDMIQRIITSGGQVEFAALSGVFVGRPHSQVDLLLVGRFGQKRLNRTVAALQTIAANEINFAVLTKRDFLDRIYSFDWFVKEVMDNDPVIVVDKILPAESRKKGSKWHLLKPQD